MTEEVSPITGTVRRILAEAGASIGEDETVVILESMKMEIMVKSPHNR